MKKLVFLFGMIAFLQGCGRIDIENQLPNLKPNLFLFKYGEFVSGSVQKQASPVSGYKVEVSAGAFTSTIKQTSPNGYTSYTSVQGANLSQ